MTAPTLAIADFLAPERVVLDLAAPDKAALIAALAQRAAAAAGLAPPRVLAALQAREALGSTGLGGGFALPHARLPGLAGFTALFVRLSKPLAFEAIDAAPVDLVFLLLMPAEDRARALAALAAIARRLRAPGVAADLRATSGPAAAFAVLTG
jgi:PTS system nitrogen regulatory IIA component